METARVEQLQPATSAMKLKTHVTNWYSGPECPCGGKRAAPTRARAAAAQTAPAQWFQGFCPPNHTYAPAPRSAIGSAEGPTAARKPAKQTSVPREAKTGQSTASLSCVGAIDPSIGIDWSASTAQTSVPSASSANPGGPCCARATATAKPPKCAAAMRVVRSPAISFGHSTLQQTSAAFAPPSAATTTTFAARAMPRKLRYFGRYIYGTAAARPAAARAATSREVATSMRVSRVYGRTHRA